MTFAVLALGLVVASDTVAFSERAMRLESLLPEIGAKVGLDLRASPSVADDVVLVRVKDVDSTTLMTRIADQVSGVWEKSGNAYYLKRTAEQEAKDQRAWQLHRQETVARQFAETQKRASKAPWNEEAAAELARKLKVAMGSWEPNDATGNSYRRINAIESQSPLVGFASRLLPFIDPASIAVLRRGQRAFFAVNPTRFQFPIAAGANQVLVEINRDLAILDNAFQAQGVKGLQRGNVTYYPTSLIPMPGKPGGNLPIESVFAELTYYGTDGFYGAFLLTDREGRIIRRIPIDLASPDQSDVSKSAPTTGWKSRPVPWSADSLALTAPPKEKKSPELVQRLLHPEDYDPLSYATQDLLLAAAEDSPNVVAYLAEFTGGLARKDAKPEYSAQLGVWLDRLYEVDRTDGWFTARPKNPADTRDSRWNRKVVAAILNRNPDSITLEDRAAFYLGLTPTAISGAANWAQAAGSENIKFDGSETTMRVFGAMNRSEREAAQKGTLTYGNLSPAAKTEIHRAIYDENTYLSRNTGDGQYLDSWYNGVLREPTICLPNGIPPSTPIRLTDEIALTVMGYSKDSDWGAYTTLTPDSLAQYLYEASHPGAFPWLDNQAINLNKFDFGQRRTINFTLTLPDGITGQLTANHNMPGYVKAVKYSQLPESFRTEVDDAATRTAEQAASMRRYNGGARNSGTAGGQQPR